MVQERVHADCLGFRFEAGQKRSETAIGLSADRAIPEGVMLRTSDGPAPTRKGQAAPFGKAPFDGAQGAPSDVEGLRAW
jgi:hypothetical protein